MTPAYGYGLKLAFDFLRRGTNPVRSLDVNGIPSDEEYAQVRSGLTPADRASFEKAMKDHDIKHGKASGP